jgi:hypothetical protein
MDRINDLPHSAAEMEVALDRLPWFSTIPHHRASHLGPQSALCVLIDCSSYLGPRVWIRCSSINLRRCSAFISTLSLLMLPVRLACARGCISFTACVYRIQPASKLGRRRCAAHAPRGVGPPRRNVLVGPASSCGPRLSCASVDRPPPEVAAFVSDEEILPRIMRPPRVI